MKLSIGKICYDRTILLPHTHGVHELIFYLHGSGTLQIPEKSFFVQAGNIAIIPPGCLHHHSPNSGLEGIYIRGDLHHILLPSVPAVVSDNETQDGRSLVCMIYHNRVESNEYMAALCTAFTHFVLLRQKTEDGVTQAVKKLISRIDEQFCDSAVDLCALLQQSGYAEDYIRAQFKQITGKTPTEFLTDLRIRQACYLIDVYGKAIPLAEVAARCGYVDYVFFSKRFKQMTGSSPRAYLQKSQAGHPAELSETLFGP